MMHYHKPPNVSWQPKAVVTALSAHAIVGTLVGEEVHASLPELQHLLPSPIVMIRTPLAPRQRTVRIWHESGRFLRNIALDLDVLVYLKMGNRVLVELNSHLLHIHESLLSLGFSKITSQKEEIETACRYCSDADPVHIIAAKLHSLARARQELLCRGRTDEAEKLLEEENAVQLRLDQYVREQANQ